MHYILNRIGEPVLCEDVLEWSRWYGTAERRVAYTEFPDGTYVSTVFLGLDHSFNGGPPVLWETMIFAGSDFAERFNMEQRRYTSQDDAKQGHENLCRELSVGLQVN